MKEKLGKVTNVNQKRLTITSLLQAVKSGNKEQIQILLSAYGLPKNAIKTTDYTIIQTSVKLNQTDITKLLVDVGCRINGSKNENDFTPLAFAIKNENVEIAAYLLEKGADLEVGKNDLTVLHLAAQQKSLYMLELLFKYTADVNCIRSGKTAFQMFFDSSIPYTQLNDDNDVQIFHLFFSKGTLIDISHDWSVLHFFATTNNKGMIQKALQATTNVNQCTNEGNTSLHHLIQESFLDEKDIADILQSFILKGADVNISNNIGDTVYHVAAKKKYLRLLQVLFLFQWDVNYCNSEGNTVLHNLLNESSSFCSDDLYYEVVTFILNMESFQFIKNNEGISCMHLAIENDHKRIVNDMLMKPDIDVNAPDIRFNNYTFLYFYLKNLCDNNSKPDNYDVEIVEKLILAGAQPDIVNDPEIKTTPIHYAILLKNKTLLKLLLDNFNFQKFESENGTSILHYLVNNIALTSETEELQMVEIAELCIKKGANISFRDNEEYTSLSVAVLRRQKYMVKTFLENGAKMDDFEVKLILGCLMENEFCQTSFSPSSESLHSQIEEVIRIPENVARDIEILEMLSTKGMNLDNKSNKGFTIFHHAASKRYTEMLSKLLHYCKDVNVRDPNGNTVLHTILNFYANVDNNEENKIIEIVEILLTKGSLALTVNDNGETPLHLAAKIRHFEFSILLLQYGADPTALDNNSNSMLHFVSMSNNDCRANAETELMAIFVDYGCDINAKNKDSMTPLLLAAKSGCMIITRILLWYGAKIDCTVDDILSTPLHVAAGCNNFGVTKELIKFGADINSTRKDGTAPLHLAVIHQDSIITRMLLEEGADTEIEDENGKTALHFACWYNGFENVNELLNFGANVNAEDKFQVTPLMLVLDSEEIWTSLYHHMIKLRAANIMISKFNTISIANHVQAHLNDAAVSIASEFYDLASIEILKMQQIPIDESYTLYDLMKMSPSNSCCLIRNQNLHKILHSGDFEENFPIYGKLMRANYEKSIARSELLVLAKDAFNNVTGLTLENYCSKKIFENLSNQDLRHIVKAVRLRKRKRISEKEHCLMKMTTVKKCRRASF